MVIMAELRNIQVYREAERGKRVFVIPTSQYAAVKVGLSRYGYGVKKSKKINNNTTEFSIYERNSR